MNATDANRPEKSGPECGEHSALFGPPPLFDGDDPKTYEQLHTEISTAVEPTDIIERILERDHVDHTSDVFRYRRFKANFMSATAYKGLAEALTPLVGGSQAETLAEGWAAKRSDVVEEVNKMLTSAGLSMDTIRAQTFSLNLNAIERIDHLIALAETRRNAALREIDRHRQTLAQKLRWAAQPLEDDQFRLIESKPIDQENVK